MPSMTITMLFAAVLSVAAADARSRAKVQAVEPTVLAYTDAVKSLNLTIPLDRRRVAELMNQLTHAIEALARGRGIKDEQFLSRIRQQRNELGRFMNMPLAADGREKSGHRLFGAATQLLSDLDQTLGTNPNAKAAINALDRSARSLDKEDPLRWQPDNIQQFLRLAGEALTQMSRRPV